MDRPFNQGKFPLPDEKAKIRQKEQRDVLVDVLYLAKTENVNLILIAGDLWDEVQLRDDTIPFVIDVLSKCRIPILITSGNCDYFSKVSHYNSIIPMARFGRKFPPNVHIFKKPNFSHVVLSTPNDITITGIAHTDDQKLTEKLFEKKIKVPRNSIRIGLFHATREGMIPMGKDKVIPFEEEEIFN